MALAAGGHASQGNDHERCLARCQERHVENRREIEPDALNPNEEQQHQSEHDQPCASACQDGLEAGLPFAPRHALTCLLK